MFECGHCGASLSVPAEPGALDARCSFCGNSTPLPAHLLALRVPPQILVQESAAERPVWLAVGVGVALLVVFGAVGFASRPASAVPAAEAPSPPPHVDVSATPESERAATEAPPTGAARTAEILRRLTATGCKDVILDPTETSGQQMLETKLAANGRCVTVLAVADARENRLALHMQTPLGERLPTPPPAPEIAFSVCPKKGGSHPTEVVPSTDGTYTVAAIECPSRSAP